MAYTTLSDFKTWAGITDSLDDAVITAVLEAASSRVDGIACRVFAQRDQVRTYSPSGYVLFVDDLADEFVTVTENGTELVLGTDFALVDHDENRPITALKRLGRPWRSCDITVEGTYGWPAVPAAVELATKLVANSLLKRRKAGAPDGLYGSPDTGLFRVSSFDADAYGLLAPFKKAAFA